MLSDITKKQVKNITVFIAVLGLTELCVFFVLSCLKALSFLPSLAGTVAGCLFSALNFVLLAFSVEKSLKKGAKGAQAHMSLTYTGRLLLTAVFVFVVIKLPNIFNLWAAVIPLVFPRIAIMLMNFRNKGGDKA